jgi:ATP-dependent DNA helicase RecG
VYVILLESKNLLVIEVEASKQIVHRFKDEVYLRLASTTRKASAAEIEVLESEANRVPFDSTILRDSVIGDLDLDKLERFAYQTKAPESLSAVQRSSEQLAMDLDFVRKDFGEPRPLVATTLLFAKDSQRFFPLSSISAIRFRGLTITDEIFDRKEIKGNLDDVIGGAITFTQQYMATGSSFARLDTKRIDIAEYPTWAVREAVANAVAHRKYNDPGMQVDLRMFDDRIEIISPGGLGGGLELKDLGTGKRYLRNPRVADILNKLKWIEQAGTGIARMRKEMKENGSPEPIIETDHNSVEVILPAHPSYSAKRNFEDALVARDNGDYPKAKELLIEALRKKPDYPEAYNALGILEGLSGSPEKAREYFKAALENHPRYIQPFFAWATLEERAGDFTKARQIYQKATQVNQKNPIAWKLWAILERRLGNFEKADTLFDKAANLDPTDHSTWQAWGQMLLKSRDRESLNRAEKYLLKALEFVRDEHIRAWITTDLARCYEKQHRPSDEIEETFEKALKLNPRSFDTLKYYAKFLDSIGKSKQATDARRKSEQFAWKTAKRGGGHHRR